MLAGSRIGISLLAAAIIIFVPILAEAYITFQCYQHPPSGSAALSFGLDFPKTVSPVRSAVAMLVNNGTNAELTDKRFQFDIFQPIGKNMIEGLE